jgi:hypothetical protein
MAAEQRKLLEQLMGASSTSRAAQLSLTDPKVCRSYLVGTCPHDLFTNTKQDIGPCPKVHNEGLKTEYEALSDREKQKYGFEYDYMRDLQKYIDDCNRRIDAAQRRLEKTPDEIRQTNVLVCFQLHSRVGICMLTITAQKHLRTDRVNQQRPPRSRNPRFHGRSLPRPRRALPRPPSHSI